MGFLLTRTIVLYAFHAILSPIALGSICGEFVLAKHQQALLNLLEERRSFAQSPTTHLIPEHTENDQAPPGFKTLWIPELKSGVFVPIEFDLNNPQSYSRYQSFAIIIPGIGTRNSIAQSLKTIGQTLNSAKNPALKVGDDRLAVMPILFDATSSGMDAAPPGTYSRPLPTSERIYRLALVFRSLFQTPGFLAGRSQGGTYALECAERFGEFEGVIAVNPSPTEPRMHRAAVQATENAIAAEIAAGIDVPINESFAYYRQNTDLFLGIRTDFSTNVRRFLLRTQPEVPVLLLISSNDSDAPAGYVDQAIAFTRASGQRQIQVFETTAHDLWYRGPLFKQVIATQAAFMYRNLRKP